MEKNVGNKGNETKVIESIREFGKPVSVGFIAWKLKVTWSTAQSILLKMSLNGQITATDTSKGYFFSLPKND